MVQIYMHSLYNHTEKKNWNLLLLYLDIKLSVINYTWERSIRSIFCAAFLQLKYFNHRFIYNNFLIKESMFFSIGYKKIKKKLKMIISLNKYDFWLIRLWDSRFGQLGSKFCFAHIEDHSTLGEGSYKVVINWHSRPYSPYFYAIIRTKIQSII